MIAVLVKSAEALAPSEGAVTGTLLVFLNNIYSNIFNPLVLLFVSLSAIVFAWGIIEMISNAGDPETVSKGKRHMVYGILGLTIIISVWGILTLVCNVIGASCS